MLLSPSNNVATAAEHILECLGAIAHHIHQCPDLDSVLHCSVHETQQLFDSDRALVYQLLPDGDGVVLAESVKDGWLPIIGQLICDLCFRDRWVEPYRQGRISAISDIDQSDIAPCHIELLSGLQVKANLVAPILIPASPIADQPSQDQPSQNSPHLWGLLILHQCSGSRSWNALHRQVIKQIADLMGRAIGYLDLQQRLIQGQPQESYKPAPGTVDQSEKLPLRAIETQVNRGDRQTSNRQTIEQWMQLQSVALDACANVIVITDRYGTIEWVNPAFVTLTGYTPAEAIGKNPSELLQSGHHGRDFYRRLWRKIGTGQVWRGELVNRRKDGSLYHEEMTITPVRNPQGQICHFIAIKQDITDRKQTETLLQHQIERERMVYLINQHMRASLDLKTILQTTVQEVRQFLDTDRVIIYRFYADWRGVVVAESVAKGWLAILDQEITDTYFVDTQGSTYHDNHTDATDDIYTAGLSECHVEFLESLQVRAKLVVPILQGQHLWGLLVAHQCQGPRIWQPRESELLQRLACQLAIAIQQSELYEQVRALNDTLEQQVQERTARLQQALQFEALLKRITDHVRDSLDEQQILHTVVEELASELAIEACDTGIYNPEQTTVTIAYEFTRDLFNVGGQTWTIAQAHHAAVYEALLSGHPCIFCDAVPNPLRSHQRRLTVLACPIRDERGIFGDLWLFKPEEEEFNDLETRLVQQVANQCAIAIRQARLYRAAQEQVCELERLNQLKDDFLSTISHELRTPMSSIILATQMLETSLQTIQTTLSQSVETGITSKLQAMETYLSILKTESQQEIQLINNLLDLTCLDAAADPLTLTCTELGLLLPHIAEPWIETSGLRQQHFEIHVPSDLPPITTDLHYLERIITELLTNACKYTPAGERITITATHEDDRFMISVSNSGVAIPKGECDRIFDRLYRIPHHDPWKHSGTGLGLALVKKMTHRIGGTIDVRSVPQPLTIFTLTLPDDLTLS